MLGTVMSAIGIFVTAIGTFIRVTPDLDRDIRRRFYRNAPKTRKLFDIRSDIKQSGKGYWFTIQNRRISRELIDYVDSSTLEEPPDEIPKKIATDAARMKAEFSGGRVDYFVRGKPSHRTLVRILTLSIEKKCRNYGLLIATIGAVLAITGAILPA